MPRIETLAARAGSRPDPTSGALSVPLQLATTFEHTPDGQLPQGWLYQRYDNPTQQETEQALAALDGAARALLFPTGMAAGATALQALPAGSHVVLCDDSYFSFRALAAQQFPRWGLTWSLADFSDPDAVRAALRPETRLLWAETPSNPLLKVCDIAALAGIAHDAGAQLLVDGTFAPPVLQQPLALGADIAIRAGLALDIARLYRQHFEPSDALDRPHFIAAANVIANGLDGRVECVEAAGFDHPMLERAAPYDLVLANILKQPLIDLAPQMATMVAPMGKIVLSGILVTQAEDVLETYGQQGFALDRRDDLVDWSTLTLTRQF